MFKSLFLTKLIQQLLRKTSPIDFSIDDIACIITIYKYIKQLRIRIRRIIVSLSNLIKLKIKNIASEKYVM